MKKTTVHSAATRSESRASHSMFSDRLSYQASAVNDLNFNRARPAATGTVDDPAGDCLEIHLTQSNRVSAIGTLMDTNIVIDDEGRVVSRTTVKGLGYGVDEVVLAKVQEWVFAPATRDGKPVPSEQELHFHYEHG